MSEFTGVTLAGLAAQSLLKRHGSNYADLLGQRQTQTGSSTAAHGASKGATQEALRQVSKEFESIFLYQMISAMRKTVGENGFLPKSHGQEIFEGMLDEEWSKKLAGTNGRAGLAELLYQQLSRQLGLEATEESATPNVKTAFMELGQSRSAPLVTHSQAEGMK